MRKLPSDVLPISLRERNYVAEIIEALEALPIGVQVMKFDVSEEDNGFPKVTLHLCVFGESLYVFGKKEEARK